MNLDQLLQCVESRSVIRYTVDLSTVSSDGIVCPPTYSPVKSEENPYIAFRSAYVNGEQRNVVVLDSPQSQSNRVELALLQAHRAKRIAYPDIEIRFPKDGEFHEPVYSVLQLSHRIYDAVLRACTLDGKPFFGSEIGKSILAARLPVATALFEQAPATLMLGAWDSNGGGGPQSAKIPRLLTSEIIGLDAVRADLSATKFDTMDIRSQVAELVRTNDTVLRFEIKGTKGTAEKEKKPSKFGFGSVPATAVPRAAVVSGALQTSVLSCSGLRHISFPGSEGEIDARRDQAGRAVLGALALFGLVAQNESGYLLRSRCELLPRDAGRLELIGRTLKDVETSTLDTESARTLLAEASRHAEDFGLKFREHILQLEADDRLQELVRRSRVAAARGESEAADPA